MSLLNLSSKVFVDLGVTDDVTGQVIVKNIDIWNMIQMLVAGDHYIAQNGLTFR